MEICNRKQKVTTTRVLAAALNTEARISIKQRYCTYRLVTRLGYMYSFPHHIDVIKCLQVYNNKN